MSDRPSALETVLVVDDENAVRSLTTRILGRAGYRVIEARNAADALRLCESSSEEFDLVLTDVVMPGLNGRELVEQILQTRPDVAVLFMSGYTEDEGLRRGVAETGFPFLQKPFSPADLVAKVREALARTRAE